MANGLVFRKSNLPNAQKARRAAQHVRMSTERAGTILDPEPGWRDRSYAHADNLTIVQTYRDMSESGLTIINRTGLMQLLEDVQAGAAGFGHTS